VTRLIIPAIQTALETAWPDNWEAAGEGLNGKAGAATDLFVDPLGGGRVENAPALLFPVSGDFVLEAEVTVKFASTFDAGVLLLWQDKDHWAKLCFEFSPQARPTVVSVVTRGYSDDCNSVSIGGERVHLRVASRGAGCVFHYSEDGSYWHLVRVFRLGEKPMKAGFLVQSPKGEGIRAEFRGIRHRQETLGDIRSGA
jgi:uncharacterized protein